MFTKASFVAAALLMGVVSGQLANLPQCALSPAIGAIGNQNKCQLTEFDCICANSDLLQSLSAAVKKACTNPSDLSTAQAAASSLCAPYANNAVGGSGSSSSGSGGGNSASTTADSGSGSGAAGASAENGASSATAATATPDASSGGSGGSAPYAAGNGTTSAPHVASTGAHLSSSSSAATASSAAGSSPIATGAGVKAQAVPQMQGAAGVAAALVGLVGAVAMF